MRVRIGGLGNCRLIVALEPEELAGLAARRITSLELPPEVVAKLAKVRFIDHQPVVDSVEESILDDAELLREGAFIAQTSGQAQHCRAS